MRQGYHIQDCIPLPVRQSSCYSLFKRHRCKVSLSTITLRVEEGAVAGAALCQAHVGVIGIEEILTALYPLLEYTDGKLSASSINNNFTAGKIEDYLKAQGRFKNISETDLAMIKKIAEDNILKYKI
jgi:hypothetical protein